MAVKGDEGQAVGGSAANVDGEDSVFKEGDTVRTRATKDAAKFNNKLATVLRVTKSKVRVKMDDGPASGATKDFAPASLTKVIAQASCPCVFPGHSEAYPQIGTRARGAIRLSTYPRAGVVSN